MSWIEFFVCEHCREEYTTDQSSSTEPARFCCRRCEENQNQLLEEWKNE